VILQPPALVLERGETALAEVVLDAQQRAQAEVERDEDSLLPLVWNDICKSARVRAAFNANVAPDSDARDES